MPACEVPVLETERLRLRGHRLDDFSALAAMWADPIVVRHTTGKPQTREEVWSRLLRYAGHWAMLGFGFWVVEDKSTSEFLGELGFLDFKREITPPLGSTPEIGWILASHAHGKGYGTEAVRAVIAWGEEHFGRVRTACLIHPENAASLRVAEKCGYREYTRTLYKDHEVILLERYPQPRHSPSR